MNDVHTVLDTLRFRYATFTGRARRREFWLFTLATFVLGTLLGALVVPLGVLPDLLGRMPSGAAALTSEAALMQSPGVVVLLVVATILSLALVVPTLAVSARRLHDRNLSGWWLLLYLLQTVPVVGTVVGIGFLVIFALPGTPGPNRFGADSKGDAPLLKRPPAA